MDLLGFLLGAIAGYIILTSISDDDDDLDPPSRPNAGNQAAEVFLSRFSPSAA